jgi:hypothetical protein
LSFQEDLLRFLLVLLKQLTFADLGDCLRAEIVVLVSFSDDGLNGLSCLSYEFLWTVQSVVGCSTMGIGHQKENVCQLVLEFYNAQKFSCFDTSELFENLDDVVEAFFGLFQIQALDHHFAKA